MRRNIEGEGDAALGSVGLGGELVRGASGLAGGDDVGGGVEMLRRWIAGLRAEEMRRADAVPDKCLRMA